MNVLLLLGFAGLVHRFERPLHHVEAHERAFGELGAAPIMVEGIAHHAGEIGVHQQGFVGILFQGGREQGVAAVGGGHAALLQGGNLRQQPFHGREDFLLQDAVFEGGCGLAGQTVEKLCFLFREVWYSRASADAKNAE